jgi:N-acetylglucosamine-6-phosphate deacetylase
MHDIGVLRAGALADLAGLDDQFNCLATLVGGVIVHTRMG